MLLNPRKFIYKNIQKKRKNYFFFKKTHINYGQVALKILQPLRLTSKHLFRFKLFLKKGSKKVDKTHRKLWINIFPYLPLTKKVIGSRMGKGKGKLKIWWVQVKPGTNLFEFKNLRVGRSIYFFKIITNKLLIKTKIINLYSKQVKSIFTKNQLTFESFW